MPNKLLKLSCVFVLVLPLGFALVAGILAYVLQTTR